MSSVFYIFSEIPGFALYEVMANAIVKYCTLHNVKLSVPLTPENSSRCGASLQYAYSASGTLSCKKSLV